MRHLRLPTVITRADVPTAIFGSWDGTVSVLAVVVGLAIARHGAAGVLVAGVSGAIGGTFSMGTGQWEADEAAELPDSRPVRVRRAVVMAVATGAGGILPVVPFWTPTAWWVQVVAAVALAVLLATGVAIVKARTGRIVRRWPTGAQLRLTYGLLAATAAATYAVGLLAG